MNDGVEKPTGPPAACVEDGGVAKTFRHTVGCKRVNYHLIRKCQTCTMYKTKNKSCFSMGHHQRIRTVRLSEDERHFEALDGDTLSHMDVHNYYRIKPGSRLLAWNDGKVEEISSADACTLKTVCLAPGTMLQHAPRSQIFSAYLNSSEPEELVDYSIPGMPKPRLMHSAGRSDKVDSDHSAVRHDVDDGESSRGRKRRKSVRKMAATSETSSNGSGHTYPGGSGGRKQDSSAEDNVGDTDVTEPSVSVFETKDQVHKALAVKLEACKEREIELRRVIDKAHSDLEENNKSKTVAIQECNDQILAIIERREAYAAHCEDLAAQARAQNISDRESLQTGSGELAAEDKRLPSVETTADTRVSSTALAAAQSSASGIYDNVQTKSGESMPRARVSSVPTAGASPRVTVAPPKGPNASDEEESMHVGKEQGARPASDELAGRAEMSPARNAEASTQVAVKSEAPTVSNMERDMQVDWEVAQPGGELLGNEGMPFALAAEASVQAAAAVAASVNVARRWATTHVDRVILTKGTPEPGNSGARLSSAPTTEPPRLLVAPPRTPVVSLTDDRRQVDRENLQTKAGERNGHVDAMPPSMSNTGAPVWAVAVSPMPCAPEQMEERFQIGGTRTASRTTGTPSPTGTAANQGTSVFYPQPSGTGIGGSGGQQIGAAASTALLLGSPPPPSLASNMTIAGSRSQRGAARSASSPLPPPASMFAGHTSAAGGAGSDSQQVTTTTSLRALPHAPTLWPYLPKAASSASNGMRVAAVPSVPLLSGSAPVLSLPRQFGLHWSQMGFAVGGSQRGASAAPTVHYPLRQRPTGTGVAVSVSHPVGEVDDTRPHSARSASPPQPSRVEGTVGDGEEVYGAASVP